MHFNRSGTEEESGELSQLLEDIYTFQRDFNEQKAQEKREKQKRFRTTTQPTLILKRLPLQKQVGNFMHDMYGFKNNL